MRLITNLQRARDRKLIVCSWDLDYDIVWVRLQSGDKCGFPSDTSPNPVGCLED